MSHPRFNHVAMSVPASLLDDEGRADILRFHDEVFGWKEMPTMTEPGRRLVLQAYTWDQFVFLIADDDPMRAPGSTTSAWPSTAREQFDEFLGRARACAERDERVDLIDHEAEDFGDFLTLHNFYVGFLLPMMVEVQYYDWAPGLDPQDRAT